MIIDASAVIATADRADVLERVFKSLAQQSHQPEEMIVVDASAESGARELCQTAVPGLLSKIKWTSAKFRGAASQRNQGIADAAHGIIWFLDDDIVLEPECVRQLHFALRNDEKLGGVNAMIVNQRYQAPGLVSRMIFSLMNGRRETSYAGKVIGPAINLLPEDSDDLPDVVPVEWLNTTCTMYRRDALPIPPFDSAFTGYSLMEDLALSLKVAQNGWKLANVRVARILHDSQPGKHKANVTTISAMELANRYYVMTSVLGRAGLGDHLKLGVYELFQLASTIRQRPRLVRQILRGKIEGLRQIFRSGGNQ